jgi:hypothetical protein
MADRLAAHLTWRTVGISSVVVLGGGVYVGHAVLASGASSGVPIYTDTGGSRQVMIAQADGTSSTNGILHLEGTHFSGSCTNSGTETTGTIEVTADRGNPVLITDDNPVPAKLEGSPPRTIETLTGANTGPVKAVKLGFSFIGRHTGTGSVAIRVNPNRGRCFLSVYAFG